MSAPIAFLTDFGLQDSYVGVMKGVVTTIAPASPVIDVTHAIRPQDIAHGAYTLAIAVPYFPQDTVFCCVVDPGVGSHRAPIAVAAGKWRFVFPDNGLLSFIFQEYPVRHAVQLDKSLFHRKPVSTTFHGRDIFASIAAHLAIGKALETVGTGINPDSLHTLEVPAPSATSEEVVGHILHIDHFGNIVTNIRRPLLQEDTNWTVYINHQRVTRGIETTYTAVSLYQSVAYIGSDTYVEIAIRNGNAAARYEAIVGQEVRLRRGATEPEIPVSSP